MAEVEASRDGGSLAIKGRVPFAPFHRMQTFPAARKKVPHAVDSPRPCLRKSKHVTWGQNHQNDQNVKPMENAPKSESPPAASAAVKEDCNHVKKKQLRRASSKGKLQWLFDQDRVYWQSPQKETGKSRSSSNTSMVSDITFSSSTTSPVMSPIPMQCLGDGPVRKPTHTSPGKGMWVPVEQLSDSVNIGEDELLKFGSSSDEESGNFDLDMSHLEMNAPEIQVFITTNQAPRISASSSPGVVVRSSNKSIKGMSGFVSREDRPGRKGKKEGWRKQAAVLKAKCEVLRMEKELAKQRWKEGCADMAQAAEMAHTLRAEVESILELQVRKRETVSEPCTPRRAKAKEEISENLAERLHRLKASSEMRTRKLDSGARMDLETQAEELHKRIELLQQKSQFSTSESSTPEDSDSGGQLSHVRTGSRTSSNCSVPLQTIDEESIKNASNYYSLDALSASANDAVYQLLKQTEDGCILEEELAKEVQTKETVREILSQIQAEAKQWEQVRQVLKHVSAEMATLQQACMGWEKRALAAEALAATWQREGDEWRVKAQTAQQKIKELEAQLLQLQETIEGVKQRHALEQNRWLDIGSGLGASVGYTLVLQPIANTGDASGCRCSISKDHQPAGGSCNKCGNLCRTSRQELTRSVSLKVGAIDKHPTQEACESGKVRQKHPVTEVTKTVATGSRSSGTAKNNERGRSVSLDRARPKVPVRRASPARSESIFTENQENYHGGNGNGNGNVVTLPTKVGGIIRGQSPVRKLPGQSPAPGCRGSSLSGSTTFGGASYQRAPLKDMRVNIPIRH